MCGIYFSQSSFNSKNINIEKLIEKIDVDLKHKKYDKILNSLRKLRCNNFQVEYLKNKKLAKQIQQIKYKVIRNKKYFREETYKDLVWCLDYEIYSNSKKILNFIKDNKIEKSKKTIIFTNYFLKATESLDYLETRGRDSASISLNFKLKKRLNFKSTTIINNSKFFFTQNKIDNKSFLVNITIKYANQVGYSGENILNLKDIFLDSKILSKIDFKNLIGFFIVGHTRWASTGQVNLSNCHPLINVNDNNYSFFYMNGDINNYQKYKKNDLTDKNCKNDLSCLPNLINSKQKISNKDLKGSYVLLYHSSNSANKLTILKNGTQGLYMAKNIDGDLILSSDVYGIVNFTNKFYRISENKSIQINPFKSKSIIAQTKSIKTIISTRDLDKKKFSRFFTKEINDTQTIIERTIDSYLDLSKNIIKNMDNIFPKKIINRLENDKIKNIIITGMGSCYTAAVGISKYLSKLLIHNRKFGIKVQATVASEGSGFYLSKNMTDTIVVIVAQSGTTIDTNVYAKLAKIRGAYTIAIANKRDGDITYIVENCLYLGNGRDVELSVPSTKTYTCHLFLGFILSEKISQILFNKISKNIFDIAKNIKNKKTIHKLLYLHDKKIDKIQFDILNYTNWVVLYDESSNSFSALEFRIKLSECCYKTVLYMHADTFKKSKLSNFLVFYVGEKNFGSYKNKMKNFYLSISSNDKRVSKNLIQLKSKNIILKTIESAITIQLISYKISQLIDSQKSFVNEPKIENKILNFLSNKKEIFKLKKLRINSRREILVDKLKRPIDAIKHQAKTVTVGAIRKEAFNKKKISLKNKVVKLDEEFSFKEKILSLRNNINLISNVDNEVEKYFFCNLIETYNFKSNKKIFFNFYHPDERKINDNNFSNIYFGSDFDRKNKNDIIVPKEMINSENLIIQYLNKSKNNILNYKNFIFAKKYLDANLSKFFTKKKFEEQVSNYRNVKFLGSGINYLVAKKYAQKFSLILNKSIGYDVIENHKHIDISSEAMLIIFASNIYRKGFQSDVVSEIEKFTAHNNKPIIFTNLNNSYFDQFSQNEVDLIRFPLVEELYSLPLFDHFFDIF